MSPTLLFVCTGNVCRSAFAQRYAELLAERGVAPGWAFASVGTHALAGAPMDPPMAAELAARGGSADGFVARQVSRADVEAATLIVAMQTTHRDYLVEEFPRRALDVYTLGQLGRAMSQLEPVDDPASLSAALRTRRAPADPADDVADPYRRGSRAAAACADTLTRGVGELLDRLP